jgi:DNA polymerase-3 subunit epsilon
MTSLAAGSAAGEVQPGGSGTLRGARQASFDELGTPLRDVVFVVVDLETTGGSPADCGITEIGAVKVRAGDVLGEFHTLVNPGASIPPFIQVLTGISDAMVATSPRVTTVLPDFLDFANGAVLVAHNAPFDIGFLKAAARATDHEWPLFGVLDTARLARQVLLRDEAPNCKLSTLARLFRATTTPNHRALEDARATVDVLHGLIERVGTQGVDTLEELVTYSSRVSPEQRRKRHLAEGVPRGPGVYVFEDDRGRPLYIGKSKDLRARVRSYFTASEMRSRMGEMVRLAERVRPIPCPTLLEAEVRELRLIAEHKPRYNRRSRFPERMVWLTLTVEPFPRLSIVRALTADSTFHLGPFSSRQAAEAAMVALHEAIPLRQCTARLSASRRTTACVLLEMGRCGGACQGGEDVLAYRAHVDAVRAAVGADCRPVVTLLEARIGRLSSEQRYEEAAAHRDRLSALVLATARMQRLAGLSGCPEIVAGRQTADLGWELAVIRHGRLAGTDVVPRGVRPAPFVDSLVATAERPGTVGPGPVPVASAEETECLLRWLDSPAVRLVRVEGTWSSPAAGAGAFRDRYAGLAAAAREVTAPGTDRRGLRPVG